MLDTPKANRLHISFFGKRNAGKSSLVNALTNQDIALVSDTPGTTTDPVFKAMELLPLGPVMIVDTAGLDDEGALGELRIKKTFDIMDRTDLAILVFTGESTDFSMEMTWKEELTKRNIPIIGVINKIDQFSLDETSLKSDFDIPFVSLSAKEKKNIGSFKQAIIDIAPTDFELPAIVGDILRPKARVVLVAPQDIQAPKGRLILPQVQIIRDILDYDGMALTVKDTELIDVLEDLKCAPDLVITDSQMFDKVSKIVPEDIPLTSFSILMARYKGDLATFVRGARAMDSLKPGDKVLIAEACTHHALKGDIAREKLPIWIKERYGDVEFVNLTGVDFPEDLKEFKLIIQCGSCMFTRKQLMSRLIKAEADDMPITNFGTAIAHLNGILDRVVNMFPEVK
ncbi:[FeFe] hydrogenase H-cluster maturation GTPase HydF [Clostridium intestinale]|uniref:[FeFe] hydrogenase H-cluster maturation GTPase HydF n=1 Tax=Clostridium intestinale TaxID=36845 RepID=UPI002DD6262A|nr:[FeFe] hydrogenase H-cluster maturation GTPase HydF [Clostridium intestinale]WRY50847.1 [FeFe] hydrogenase H-cluster maturation GTPase HydF [Clostridium intestinale]